MHTNEIAMKKTPVWAVQVLSFKGDEQMKKVALFLMMVVMLAAVSVVFAEDEPTPPVRPDVPKMKADFFGDVKSFDAEKRELVLAGKTKDRTFTLAADAKILKGKGFKEEGTVEDIKPGMRATGVLVVGEDGKKTDTVQELRISPARQMKEKVPPVEKPDVPKVEGDK